MMCSSNTIHLTVRLFYDRILRSVIVADEATIHPEPIPQEGKGGLLCSF